MNVVVCDGAIRTGMAAAAGGLRFAFYAPETILVQPTPRDLESREEEVMLLVVLTQLKGLSS